MRNKMFWELVVGTVVFVNGLLLFIYLLDTLFNWMYDRRKWIKKAGMVVFYPAVWSVRKMSKQEDWHEFFYGRKL
jgi:hypothetical protein